MICEQKTDISFSNVLTVIGWLLVDKYKRSIYALALSRIRNFHDAQDITQEVFIKAYQNLHTLRRWDNFIGWLYRITINLCKDWYRSRSKHPDHEFIEDQDIDTLDHVSIDAYNENRVYDSIYREVLSLRYFGGMKVNEMSSFLGISTRTVDRRLNEAISRLKEETLAMITTTREKHELPSSFTFRVVEIIKHIKVNPISPLKALPFGLTLAIGIIAGFLSIGTHLTLFDSVGIMSGFPLPSDAKVQKIGEIPVDILKVSNISVISNQHLSGNGLGSIVPSLQNALFMAPQAGDTWTKKADMPTARHGLVACAVDGKIYVIGGMQGLGNKFMSTLEVYDPKNDTWETKAPMPIPKFAPGVSIVNGKIYVIGGATDGWGRLSSVEEYDPQKDKWVSKSAMPTPRYMLSASAVNNKIYAIGGVGIGLSVLSNVEEYDPQTDTWVRKSDMLTARYGFGTGAVNGKIYASGGGINDNLPQFAVVEEYNSITDTWVS
jgi:RNA polymerase sigma factor (sigma-70 family)